MSPLRPALVAVVAGTLLAACDAPPPAPAEPADPVSASIAAAESEPAAGRLRLRIPQDISFPFYTRTEVDPNGEYGYKTDAWAAVVFYRPPEVVPASFNLLQFYDFAAVPGIFALPTTVEGVGFAADPTLPPAFSLMRGRAGGVPIWFVRRTAWEGLAGDGVVTRAELEALPPTLLKRGTATQFTEVFRGIETSNNPGITIVAQGPIAGGGRFEYAVVWNGILVSERDYIRIRIRP